eukprot:13348982-Alexandrium_andersonii.AAC.1
MMLAFLMRPWVVKCRGLGLIPRLLADDFHIWAEADGRKGAAAVLGDGLEATLQFLDKVGGRPQPPKSRIAASSRALRITLAGR